MDPLRFDDLARRLARRLPRRQALHALGAVVAAASVGSVVPDTSARVCRIVGEHCGKGFRGRCCEGASCNKRKSGRGVCTCRPGLTSCNGICFDIANDPRACGARCRACPDDTDCCNGGCCPPGWRCCGGVCTDLTGDDLNCGGCTQECPEGLTCCGSRCRLLEADPHHCGKCGNACGLGYLCQQGQCVCPAGWQDCGDGICRNLQANDDNNCGQCGNACSRLTRCQQGQCVCGRDGTQCVEPHNPVTVCGVPDDGRCTENYECCSGSCVRDVSDIPGGYCYPCLGRTCDGNHSCCGGYACLELLSTGEKFCGTCGGQDAECVSNSDCCFADCTVEGEVDGIPYSTCQSLAGGRCSQNHDCRACEEGRRCVGACIGGRCQF